MVYENTLLFTLTFILLLRCVPHEEIMRNRVVGVFVTVINVASLDYRFVPFFSAHPLLLLVLGAMPSFPDQKMRNPTAITLQISVQVLTRLNRLHFPGV